MRVFILSVFLVISSLFQGVRVAQPRVSQTTRAVSAHPRVLVVGDGLSVGYDATDPQHRYVSLLAQSLHARLTVRAAGGILTPALYDALRDNPPAPADIIVVELGTDDGGIDYLPFLQRYPEILALLRRISPNAVLVCSGPWQPHSRTQDGNSRHISAYCEAQGGMYVDLQRLYAIPVYHWATRTQQIAWLSVHSDPFLPNNAGMAAISSAFLAAIHSEYIQRGGLAPSPLIVAIICACIGGFFIVLIFAVQTTDGRRRQRRRRGRRSKRLDEAKRITRTGWEQVSEPAAEVAMQQRRSA